MNPRLKALLDEKQRMIQQAQALDNKPAASWTDEDREFEATFAERVQGLDAAIDRAKSFSATIVAADAALNGAGFSAAAVQQMIRDANAEETPRYFGKVRTFAGTPDEASRKAYRFGQWVLAALGRPSAVKYCQTHGIPIVGENGNIFRAALGQNETVNEDGGALVPIEFGTDIIRLVETYGAFRANARIQPMGSDTFVRRRRKGGLTAYFKADGAAATASKAQFDLVQLNAKKVMVFDYITTELSEDATAAMGDLLAWEIGWAFAKLEDDCGFNGDGTSTYGGIVGVRSKLLGVSGTIANIKGLVVGTGNAYSELTKTDFETVKGRLPLYADTPNTKWIFHRSTYYGVAENILTSLGGVTMREGMQASGRTPMFLGYPVQFSQVMPATEANSQVMCLFGDLALAADFGDRRMTTIDFSREFAFDSDEIAIRGTERFDINVHDVGDTTAPGPMVGLITAAS